jgi:hypothetical protein
MSDDILRLLEDDDGDWPKHVEPAPPPGHVDVTTRLSNGDTWRVATFGEEIRLTCATSDGMATLRLARGDVDMLRTALDLGDTDVRRGQMGQPW